MCSRVLALVKLVRGRSLMNVIWQNKLQQVFIPYIETTSCIQLKHSNLQHSIKLFQINFVLLHHEIWLLSCDFNALHQNKVVVDKIIFKILKYLSTEIIFIIKGNSLQFKNHWHWVDILSHWVIICECNSVTNFRISID